jgi:hypothetical protein
MKTLIIFCVLLLAVASSFAQGKKTSIPIKIKWVSNIKGDFSFAKKWSYPEGVEVNEYGQVSCNGFCPPETDAMMDSKGRIFKDSLTAYYKTVDTSHQSYSIDCKAWCYEWAGADFIEAVRKSADTIYCYTLLNAATHCSLQLNITGDNCYAIIELNSVAKGGNARYYCRNGSITIDKDLWAKGIMKAMFSFNFEHKENPKKPMYWKGKILTKIKSS